jgi:hypothetical protein
MPRVHHDSRWVPYLRAVSLGAWKAVWDFWKGDPDAVKRFSRSLKSDRPGSSVGLRRERRRSGLLEATLDPDRSRKFRIISILV